jgi:hypothetical protein
MSGYIGIPKASFDAIGRNVMEILNSHIGRAYEAIQPFMVSFIVNEQAFGSGTFVKACGLEGVLTANHVAKDLFTVPDFCMCVIDKPHRLEVTPEVFKHVPIGTFSQGAPPEEGPDLSFLVFQNHGLLERIREVKKFYPLDNVKEPSLHLALNPRLWAVTGTEGSECLTLEKRHPNEVDQTRVKNFCGSGMFPWHSFEKGDFDYLKITVPSGEYKFPYRYRGMSGGAFWFLPMEADASKEISTIGHRFPVLAGVEFSELERDLSKRERILVGHGIKSIYRKLRQTLSSLSQNH